MKLLVHICCGPCAIYPLKKILDGKPVPEGLNQGMDVWGFFFNPNIHPYTEYKKRLEAVKILADKMDIKMIYRDEYGLEEFLKHTLRTETVTQGFSLENVKPEGLSYNKRARCGYCYSSRLEATAIAAKENRFDYFSSSLLYSKYQDHDEIKKIGLGLADKYGVAFYYDDFRIGWKEGIKESKDMGHYRQQYCGCIFSEKERYLYRAS
ncbi:MAG: epoxyqueuosine reductase QueH [Deltaproteobacteria bacterium]|nr:epoxyqueuosine reductase QueH [Deltaproteobacteria bacterium]